MVMENGAIVGYVMPKLDDTLPWIPVVEYYNRSAARGTGRNQAREIQISDRVRIAENLALGYKAIHEKGYVIGDINEKNAEANRLNDVALMDCDSYGFTDPATGREFSNNMGRPEFQAPEAQGDYANRTQEQDLFGLAVLIFQLLTGYHPYTVTGRHAQDYSTHGARISAWLFPPAVQGVTAPDPYNQAWNALTDKQKELFRRVFDKNHKGRPRPKPGEWVEALMEMPAVATAPAPGAPPRPRPTRTPHRPGPARTPPRPGPARTPRPSPAPAFLAGGDSTNWVLALAGYVPFLILSFFTEFNPWWWLSLLLIAALLLYLPAKRLLSRPISIVRWILIVLASIVYGLTLLSAAMNTWPWWLWLATALGMASILLVPYRDRLLELLRSLNAQQRRIAIRGLSLLAVGAAITIAIIALSNLGTDDSGASGPSASSAVSGSGTGATNGASDDGGATSGSGTSASNGASASSGTSGGNGASVPPSLPPAIPGVETPPTVTIELSPSSISENGGSATLTASLSSPSSATTTLTVSIAPSDGADSADYTLSKPTLTIGAGATTSADSLTVSAIDNETDAPDKTVSIYGGASNELGAIDPAAVTLTITDDDATPVVTLELSSSSISENGEAANVTASLSAPLLPGRDRRGLRVSSVARREQRLHLQLQQHSHRSSRFHRQHRCCHHHRRRQQPRRAGQVRHGVSHRHRARCDRSFKPDACHYRR